VNWLDVPHAALHPQRLFANDSKHTPGRSAMNMLLAVDGSPLFSSLVAASPGDGGLSFLGIVFDDARIARVRITAGGAIPGEDDSLDVVVMDDFIYGEPKAIR